MVVALGQAGPLADHFPERPERDPLAVGRGPALVPVDVLGDAVDVLVELPGEAALAHARVAHDAYETRPSLARRRVEHVLEQAELPVAPDERRLELAGPAGATDHCDDADRAPRRDGRRPALEELLTGRLERDRAGRGPERALADKHGAGRRDRLEPAGRVDEVTGHHALVPGADRDRGLTGQDGRTGSERFRGGSARVQVGDRLDQLQGGPDGPLCVVFVGRRRAPHGHDGIADELLDRAAVPRDDLLSGREVAGQEFAGLLRVARFCPARGADEIGEHDRDEPPLRLPRRSPVHLLSGGRRVAGWRAMGARSHNRCTARSRSSPLQR